MMTLFCWYLENNPRVGFFIPIDQFGLLLSFIGFVSMIAGMVVFLVAASKDRRHRAVNCAGCMMILFTWLISVSTAAAIREHLDYQERVEKTTHTIITLHQLSAEIEAFRERLGRLPDNEMSWWNYAVTDAAFYKNIDQLSRCSKDEYYLSCA